MLPIVFATARIMLPIVLYRNILAHVKFLWAVFLSYSKPKRQEYNIKCMLLKHRYAHIVIPVYYNDFSPLMLTGVLVPLG